jgi:hypothetical protein
MERKREIALAAAAALIVAAVVVYRARSAPAEAVPASRPQAAGSVVAKQPPKPQPAAELNLEALNAPRPRPVETNRNPFRFKPKPPPPPPPPPLTQPVVTQPAQPVGPPPPPPIPLKFIGKVESGKAGLVAVLSDNRGVYQGRQGDIIEGRYRILRIGVESVDLAYLDGRGRQTIRLTGQ